MAKSENQGLQIAVIIFAFLTIALSVATFYFFNDGQTQFANTVQMQEKATQNETLARSILEEKNALLILIGHTNEAKVPDVTAKFKETTALFTGVQGANYIAVIQGIKATLDSKTQEVNEQRAKLLELATLINNIKTGYDTSVAATKQDFDKRNQDLMTQVNSLDTKDKEHITKVKSLTDELEKKRADLAKAIDEKNKEIQNLEKERTLAMKIASDINKKQYEADNWVFERPDAKIISVNPREATVNIDVGRRDYLRLNIQFAVFPREESNVYNRKKKGTITVTKFINDNLAEARIVNSEQKDPILQGDVVYTPTWSPGTQERFVLAGDFDVNGDRKNDNTLVRTLVEMNGGMIDEEVSQTTRYLLLGDAPANKGSEEWKKFDKQKSRAKELSVKLMGIQEFIDYTDGRELIAKLQSLDTRGDGDTKGLLKEGAKRQLGQEIFKVRTPEGGARRLEPGSPRAESPPAGSEGSKKLPPRQKGGIQ